MSFFKFCLKNHVFSCFISILYLSTIHVKLLPRVSDRFWIETVEIHWSLNFAHCSFAVQYVFMQGLKLKSIIIKTKLFLLEPFVLLPLFFKCETLKLG